VGGGLALGDRKPKGTPWPKSRASAIAAGFKWGKCSKPDCHKEGAYDDPSDKERHHRHCYPCSGYFGDH
jgi:hypothetical protein